MLQQDGAMIRDFLIVGLGGALGGMLRYGVSLAAAYYTLHATVATLIVNVVGSFALGWMIGCVPKGSIYLFGAIGLCGGFTTFSTFSAQSLELFQTHRYGLAMGYTVLSLLMGVASAALGLYLGNKFCK